MTLTVVNADAAVTTDWKEDQDRIARIKGEVVSLLEDKLEDLRIETEKVNRTLSEALVRINTQGFYAELSDLRSGHWHKTKAEVEVLQEVLQIFGAFEQNLI